MGQLVIGLEEDAVVVIDPRAHSIEDLESFVAKAKARGAKVLGYLSVGEVHEDDVGDYREFVAEREGRRESDKTGLEEILIDRNETFASYRVDVLSPTYRAWIEVRAAGILGRGLDGLFLDTIDTVDTYLVREKWDLDRREESVNAMMALVRGLKKRFPDHYLLQNGGLNLIGEKIFVGKEDGRLVPGLHLAEAHPHNPDGILWENAFAGADEWTQGRHRILDEIVRAGHVDVFALGYEAAFPLPERLFERAGQNGFIGSWGRSSLVLHMRPTLAPGDRRIE
jgi:endo-alpha-1,4-polygalactosaminidase (GH114 family)